MPQKGVGCMLVPSARQAVTLQTQHAPSCNADYTLNSHSEKMGPVMTLI